MWCLATEYIVCMYSRFMDIAALIVRTPDNTSVIFYILEKTKVTISEVQKIIIASFILLVAQSEDCTKFSRALCGPC